MAKYKILSLWLDRAMHDGANGESRPLTDAELLECGRREASYLGREMEAADLDDLADKITSAEGWLVLGVTAVEIQS